ncbi:MAG: hypothetical protein K2M83_12840 [Muribaculaceae bacterium]|nr:hypothetical protein [Muribaculaceae bacterium]
MKTRAKHILSMTASALTLLAVQTSSAAAAPTHAPAASEPQTNDTIVYSTTKSLLESINELSKTSGKLSEAALKLLESQGGIKAPATPQQAPKRTEPATQKMPEPTVQTTTEPAPQQTPTIIRDTVYITVHDTVNTSTPILPEGNRTDGQFLWIPDASLRQVQAALNGEVPESAIHTPDLNEKTFWRGDSIPMALPTKRLGRYDRKLYNWLIYPKGLWHISLSANYGELNTEDMEILDLINDIDLHGKIYSIKPSVSYFLRNNLCVGLRLAFTKGDMGIKSFNVDIDEDINFNLHDIQYTSDSYSAAVFMQQYFGLSRRGRFAVFNEAEVSVGTGNSHFIRPFDGALRDTRTKTQSFNINYSPGVSIMMMKNAAFNLSFGIFGFHLKNEKQWENGEESGSRFTSGINFRFNIFNINFGVSVII